MNFTEDCPRVRAGRGHDSVGTPTWIRLQVELDLNTCWLEAAQAKVGRLAAGGIMRMVDEATGFRRHRLAELRQLLVRRKQLKRRWNIVTGDSIPAEGEDELIAAIDREAPPAPCHPLRSTP